MTWTGVEHKEIWSSSVWIRMCRFRACLRVNLCFKSYQINYVRWDIFSKPGGRTSMNWKDTQCLNDNTKHVFLFSFCFSYFPLSLYVYSISVIKYLKTGSNIKKKKKIISIEKHKIIAFNIFFSSYLWIVL